MKLTKGLLESGLLDHARNSASFYAISDHLQKHFKGVTLDLGENSSISVIVKNKTVGFMDTRHQSGIVECRMASEWRYWNEGDSALNLQPQASEACVGG